MRFTHFLAAACFFVTNGSAAPTTMPTPSRNFIIRANDEVSKRIVDEFGKDLLSEAKLTMSVMRTDRSAWITVTLPSGGAAQLTPGAPYTQGVFSVTQSPTIFDPQQNVFRCIGTISIRAQSKTVSADFQVCAILPPQSEKRPNIEPCDFSGSIIWGEVTTTH